MSELYQGSYSLHIKYCNQKSKLFLYLLHGNIEKIYLSKVSFVSENLIGGELSSVEDLKKLDPG